MIQTVEMTQPMPQRASGVRLPKSPKGEVLTITPEMAGEWLSTMVTNRPVSDSRVVDYAVDMDQGKWSLNGESIKFNDKGQLIDGQHRMRACILAGKDFESMVIFGVSDENAFATIDAGKTRTHADVFGISGVKNSNNVASATMVLFYYKRKILTVGGPRGLTNEDVKRIMKRGSTTKRSSTSRRPSKQDLLAFAESVGLDKIGTSVAFAERSLAKKLIPVNLIAAAHFLFAEKNREEADKFFNDLGAGAELTMADPVYRLREKLISMKSATTASNRWAQLYFMFVTWNKRRQGESCKQLKIVEATAEFPKLV